MRLIRRLFWRLMLLAILVLVVLPIGLMGLYLYVPPLATPLMLIRAVEGQGMAQTWVPLAQMPASLPAAAIAAEDNQFCRHAGFDLGAIREQVERYRAGKSVRGASGISQQTAKNLFLWPERGWLGKALEAYLTLGLEQLWPKARILEVYLNIAELGPGVYGVEAGAQRHFGRSVADLSKRQSALLVSILPSPLHWSAAKPNKRVGRKARVVAERIGQISDLLDCY